MLAVRVAHGQFRGERFTQLVGLLYNERTIERKER
jgi:hypothetical protein